MENNIFCLGVYTASEVFGPEIGFVAKSFFAKKLLPTFQGVSNFLIGTQVVVWYGLNAEEVVAIVTFHNLLFCWQ